VITAVAVSPISAVSVAASIVNVSVLESKLALEGAVVSIPKPRATTRVSAMRLNPVFVDIDFLSKVVPKTFLGTAGKDRFLAS